MPESMGVESQLEEAARLTNLGFYKRARKILEPLCDQNERARDLLVIVDKLEADFEEDRNKIRVEAGPFIVAAILIIFGFVALFALSDLYGAISLFLGAFWFFRQVAD